MKTKGISIFLLGLLICIPACGVKETVLMDTTEYASEIEEGTITFEEMKAVLLEIEPSEEDTAEENIAKSQDSQKTDENINLKDNSIEEVIESCLSNNNYNKTEDEQWIIYECEPAEESFYDEAFTVRIKKDFTETISYYDQAKDFFRNYLNYDYLKHYEYSDNEHEIKGVFCAEGLEEGTHAKYYYVYEDAYVLVNQKGYLVCVSGQTDVLDDLLESFWTKEKLKQYTRETVECDNDSKIYIIEEIDYGNKKILYEIYNNGKLKPEYTMEVLVNGTQYTLLVWVNQEVVQCIKWEVGGSMGDNLPDFLDANGDGYIDMLTVTSQDVSKGLADLYLWNNQENQFDKVDGLFGEVSAKDGQLWNWFTHPTEQGRGLLLQIFEWNKNELVLISEEKIEPDEEAGDEESVEEVQTRATPRENLEYLFDCLYTEQDQEEMVNVTLHVENTVLYYKYQFIRPSGEISDPFVLYYDYTTDNGRYHHFGIYGEIWSTMHGDEEEYRELMCYEHMQYWFVDVETGETIPQWKYSDDTEYRTDNEKYLKIVRSN